MWQPTPPRVQTLVGGGLFRDYEWMPDSYDNFLQAKKRDRIEAEQKQKQICDRPFILGMDQYIWKYMDCFIPQEKQQDYVIPYFVSDDPYEDTEL